MSEEKETLVEETSEIIPAKPGEQPPVPKLTELERALLSEVWGEFRASSNAQIALLNEAKRFDAERRAAEAEAKAEGLANDFLKQQLNQQLQQLRQQYNIPDGYRIDPKTGIVSPPEEEPK